MRLIPPNLTPGCHGRHLGDLIHAFPKARFIEDLGRSGIPLPSHGERGAPWRRHPGTRVHHGHHRTRGFQEAFALQTFSLSLPCNAQAQVDEAVVGREQDANGDPRVTREAAPGATTVDTLHCASLAMRKPVTRRWLMRVTVVIPFNDHPAIRARRGRASQHPPRKTRCSYCFIGSFSQA